MDLSQKSGEEASAARQLITLYRAAKSIPGGRYLELGTDRGQSTRIILQACKEVGGKLYSVDIRDCSSVAADDENWTFIQSNSIDTAKIFCAAPALKNGIDLLYVDSLHTAEHVLQEVYCYFEFMNKGSAIFFDDVDCVPDMKGKRKDNPMAELANRDIHKVVRDIYYDNMDQLQLKIH